MENAAKALLMAAGILFAILILTVGVYLRGNFSKTADSYNSQLESVELQKYNSYFEIYADEERRTNITAQEIVSLISVTQQMNQQTQIIIEGIGDVSGYDEGEKNELLEDKILKYTANNTIPEGYNIQNTYSYVNNSIEYDEFGKVIKIKFKEN